MTTSSAIKQKENNKDDRCVVACASHQTFYRNKREKDKGKARRLEKGTELKERTVKRTLDRKSRERINEKEKEQIGTQEEEPT